MLARATAMAAGLHLTLFDFEGAEALQSEACELARGVGFAPPIVSAGIDSLLTFARIHEPGRAERLLEETAAAAASTAGWHQWLWQLRLTQARAELALARRRPRRSHRCGNRQHRAEPRERAAEIRGARPDHQGARSACARANSRRYRRRKDCCERRRQDGRSGAPSTRARCADRAGRHRRIGSPSACCDRPHR